MSRNRLLWGLAVTVLLLAGLLWSRAHPLPLEPDVFRAWFWSQRSLDLLVQGGLILAGALGVAAILPGNREEESELCTWL